MKLEQSIEVAAAPARVWSALADVPRLAPCLPGASITGQGGDGVLTGEFAVRLGPASAIYSGTLRRSATDDAARTATIEAAGIDRRGQGGATATIICAVSDAGPGRTRLAVSSEYRITGRLARFGRAGTIDEVSAGLLDAFSANLAALLSSPDPVLSPDPAPAPAPATAHPAPAPDAPDAGLAPATGSGRVPAVALVLGFLLALALLRRRS